MKEENEIYIASKKKYSVGRYHYEDMYIDVFTNLKIVDTWGNDDKDIFSFVKETYLHDYIVSFSLGQLRYSYEDMKNIPVKKIIQIHLLLIQKMI